MVDQNTSLPQVITRCKEISAVVSDLHQADKKVGLVPTMGALHEGHLSLVAAARRDCDIVIVWIFVNPTQFGPTEDFQQYPRTLQADLEKLSRLQIEYVFAPLESDIYGPKHQTFVEVSQISARYEGEHRPSHFRGVATIVLKMLLLIPADVVYFGQKDYQQCLVIQQMVADLQVPTTIQICPTVRENDGLAMSSRNAYLSDSQRQQALGLSQSLQHAATLFADGERTSAAILQQMQQMLISAGVTNIDYLAIADSQSLEPLERIEDKAVVLVAATVGKTRLIDNCLLQVEMSK